MRGKNEEWVEKCIDIRVEDRIPVRRPGRIWLENVETDMEELEIDREDVHDRNKWRKNVMKKKSKPIG